MASQEESQSSRRILALIRGYYGYRNMGDESMLHVLTKILNRIGIECIVASKNPSYTKKIHKCRAIFSGINLELIKTLLKSHILIEGPGNKHGFLSIIDYGLPFIAKILGKKVMYIGVGLNPHKWRDVPTDSMAPVTRYNPIVKSILKLMFNNIIDMVKVRDELSRKLLIANGIYLSKESVIKDLAFYLKTLPRSATVRILEEVLVPSLTLKHNTIKQIDLIGISVRRFKNSELDKRFKLFLFNSLYKINSINGKNVHYVFIPFSFGKFDNDVLYSIEIIKFLKQHGLEAHFHIAYTDNPIYIKSIVKMCRFIIGVRYHSQIFAESEHIPYIAIMYDPKSLQIVRNSKTCIFFFKISSLLDDKQFNDILKKVKEVIEEFWK